MLNRLLVPLDGSDTAESILPHVRRLLRRSDSEVIVLRVVPPPPVEEQPFALDSLLAAARQYTISIKDRLEGEGVRATVRVEMGPAGGTILDVAEEEKVSMITMATHGRTGLPRALVGSVTEIVLRKSNVPVFAVRPFPGAPPLPMGRSETDAVRNILVPMDLSAPSGSVLEPAIDLAKLFQARLIFLHVVLPGTDQGGAAEESARAGLREFSARAEAEGVGATEMVDRGDVVPAILENARFHGCDVIAMSTHGRSGMSRLMLGSVTEQVLREASLPLMVVRAERSRTGAEKGAPAKAKR